jgi:hypothetical protein
MHNEKLQNLYSSPNIIRMIKSRKMRWAGHGDARNAYKIFVGKHKGRPVGRPRLRWEDNIKMDIKRSRVWGID